MEISQHAVQIR